MNSLRNYFIDMFKIFKNTRFRGTSDFVKNVYKHLGLDVKIELNKLSILFEDMTLDYDMKVRGDSNGFEFIFEKIS